MAAMLGTATGVRVWYTLDVITMMFVMMSTMSILPAGAGTVVTIMPK